MRQKREEKGKNLIEIVIMKSQRIFYLIKFILLTMGCCNSQQKGFVRSSRITRTDPTLRQSVPMNYQSYCPTPNSEFYPNPNKTNPNHPPQFYLNQSAISNFNTTSTNIFETGVNYKCVNDEVGGLCGQKIDRVSPENIAKIPHRHIGAVISVGPGGSIQFGTGILLSKNLVLTCAHVIYNKQYQAYYDKIIFYPALYGDMKKWIFVQNYQAPQKYGKKNEFYDPRSYDYALLKLKQPIDQSGFLQLSDDPSTITLEDTLSIYGYPVSMYETQKQKPVGSKQYGLERKGYILDLIVEAGYISHRISAEAGQSGAPVVRIDQTGKMSIIGIHIGSTEQGLQEHKDKFPDLSKINLTKVFNKLMIKNLKIFAQKLNGEPFMVLNELKIIEKSKQQIQQNENPIKQVEPIQQQTKKQQIQQSKIVMSPTLPTPNTIKIHFDKGINYYNTKLYQKAIQCFQMAITIDPNCPEVYYYLGLAFEKCGRIQNAVQNYQKTIKIDPKNGYARNSLTLALKNLNSNQKIINTYRNQIQRNPRDADSYNNLGVVLKGIGRYQEALGNYFRAIQINPYVRNSYENIRTLLTSQQSRTVSMLENSFKFLKNVVSRNPNNQRAKITLQFLRIELSKMQN